MKKECWDGDINWLMMVNIGDIDGCNHPTINILDISSLYWLIGSYPRCSIMMYFLDYTIGLINHLFTFNAIVL